MIRRLTDRLLRLVIGRSYTCSQRLTVTVTRTVDGVRYRVPLMFGVGENNLTVGPMADQLVRLIRSVCRCSPGTIVDVGCNIGQFLKCCILADQHRAYVGFDVSLPCCFYVRRFIAENALADHSVLPIGLSDRPEVRQLLANVDFDVNASISPDAHYSGKLAPAGWVVTETGDRVLTQMGISEVALVKLDVEGHELEVLRGLENTLRLHRPFVIFEILVYAHLLAEISATGDDQRLGPVVEHRRSRAEQLERFLRERDYVLFHIKELGALAPAGTLDPGAASNLKEMDHLAVPREKLDAFVAACEVPILAEHAGSSGHDVDSISEGVH